MHNHLKNVIMKFVKLSIVALSLGLFVTSCGSSETKTETPATTEATTTEAVAAPAPAATPDTMTAAPAKPDTAKATAPAGH
jgi:multisubunit Na+/H+ antiporter MnhC subunit